MKPRYACKKLSRQQNRTRLLIRHAVYFSIVIGHGALTHACKVSGMYRPDQGFSQSTIQPREATLTVWDRRYARRQGQIAYSSEDLRIAYTKGDRTSLIQAFLRGFSSTLDPPDDLRFSELKDYLEIGPFANFDAVHPTSVSQDTPILLDDRRDATGSTTSTRLWDSVGKNAKERGYLNYPPEGEVSCCKPVSISEFIHRSEKVR